MSRQTPYSSFLLTVATQKAAPRGPDGGYLVPRHLYSHLLSGQTTPSPDGVPDPPPAGTRVFALAPLSNQRLLAQDEMAAQALLVALVDTLCLKLSAVPREALLRVPLELEASAEATYRTHNGKLVSAFANDETVFRLTLRLPEIPPSPQSPAPQPRVPEAIPVGEGR